jgi:peptidoglycan/xylan/chitin deacetylase (PgdA/CDA1 family)
MKQPPLLLYHWLQPSGEPSTSRSPQLEISPALFDRQMQFLHARGYETVSLSQLYGKADDRPLPPRPVVITFDDGTLDFWQHARPVLQRYGFTATLFVVTDYVGKQSGWDRQLGEPARPLMNWDQIREARDAGFEIGAHSRTHRVFTGLSADDVRTELESSREMLREQLGMAPEFFAYPRGFFTQEHMTLAEQAGFTGAVAVILDWRDILHSKRFALRRMPVKGTESMLGFRARLALSRAVPLL